MNKQALEQLKQFLAQLSSRQKVAISAVAAVSIVSLIFLMVWANRPDYALLYSSLDAGDAAQIVDDLKRSSVPYKLRDGGTTILVPSKDVYELRIAYAGKNLISSGTVGYEIFDKNNLGLTEFMQKVNLKRALQGELSKTINQIDAVRQSRVHLVIPEDALFEDQEKKASASVVVKLKSGFALTRKQIVGVTQLVAASIEGLSAEEVTIVDSHGNILTAVASGVDEMGLSSSQLELKQKVEKYLGQKAQTMLDAVLGKENAIVRVAASLTFDRISRTTERYDPDNTAILSEEQNAESTTKLDTSLYKRENSVTNYEINKVVEQFQGSTGDIKQISVAVFVNSVLKQDSSTGNETYIQRSTEEIQKITEIVKSAVGFIADRNDEIVVHQLAFDRSVLNREKEILASMEKTEFRDEMIKIGLLVLGGILVFVMLRSLFKKFGIEEFARNQQAQLLRTPASTTDRIIGERENPEELLAGPKDAAREKIKAQERISKEVTDFAEMDPGRAARILKYWLIEADQE